MVTRPSVLCPIDFSDASRGALRYAAALAEHFYATLYVLTVDDPLLLQAATVSFGTTALKQLTHDALHSFIKEVFPGRTPQVAELKPLIRVGEAAPQILRVAAAVGADAIVMSTHGISGIRKRLFGSTTERVLRDTRLPVVVTPACDPGPESLEDWTRSARRILVPLDLSEFSLGQLRVGVALAEGMGASVVLAHVLEPVAVRSYHPFVAGEVDAARRATAINRIDELCATLPSNQSLTVEVAVGDPAGEIARLAREQGASAIVMALHSSRKTGRRIGSVTYRLLCQTPSVVLALPPVLTKSGSALATVPMAAASAP